MPRRIAGRNVRRYKTPLEAGGDAAADAGDDSFTPSGRPVVDMDLGVAEATRRRLGVDTRALAAFRVAVGCLLLADLAYRARSLRAFYTDAGAVPRSLAAALYPTLSSLSLHALSGTARFQRLLFAVAAVLAVLLVVGYRTRLVAAGSWLLLASLQFRNYLVLNGGDTVLLVALFLGLFLPLGERWSVDAVAADRAPRRRVAGFAAAALLSQVVCVYATNAVFKLRSDVWTAGVAVRYVFALDRFTVRLGDLLAAFPALLTAVNWAWLGLLVASPLLVVAADRGRTALVAAFAAAHVGMYLTMDLGFFPHAMLACLLLFLPSPVWDRLETAVGPTAAALRRRVDSSRFVHAGPLLPARPRRVAARLVPAVTATVLVGGLLWQAGAVGAAPSPEPAPVDPAEHSWKLFAPTLPATDGWFVVTGRLASGATVDLYPHANTSRDRPPDVAATYPGTRWRKYLTAVRADDRARRAFADYLCRRGTARHGAAVETVAVDYVRVPVRPDDPATTERVELGRYRCESPTGD